MRQKPFFTLIALSTLLPTFAFGTTDGSIADEMVNIRDPFKRPNVSHSAATLSPLESIPLENFKLLGVITGPERVRAMVANPEGKTFFVAEKMKIGTRSGVIRKITPEAVFVREKIVNVLGQEEDVETEIRLSAKADESQAFE